MERRRIVDGLDAVIQILQLVHQLAAGHQLLVKTSASGCVMRRRWNGKMEKMQSVLAGPASQFFYKPLTRR
jgi:hypothetical protein